MRKVFLFIVLVLSVLFIIASISEIETILETIRRGNWLYLLLAIFAECLWLVNLAASYHAIYHAIGIQEVSVWGLIPVIASANFVNVIAPSAGMSGITILLARAKRMKYSSARVTVAGSLFFEADYLAFLCVLAVGMFVLIRRDNLRAAEVSAAGILVLLALGLGSLLYLGMRSEKALSKALVFLSRLVNGILHPFIKREYLQEAHAVSFAHDLVDGLQQVKQNPKRMLLPLVFALINKALLLAIFTLVFLAFNIPISLGTVIAGFSIGYLFLIVSPTPAGIGVVEGSLALALSSMYIPLGIATILTMAYRGITFWFPLLVGMISLRWLGKQEQLSEVNNP